MAITFDTSAGGYTVTAVTDSSSNTTITGSKPANVVDGDLIIAYVINTDSGNPGAITPPAGLTTLIDADGGNGSFRAHSLVAYRIASSEPSTYEFTLTAATTDDVLILQRVTGHDATTPVYGAPAVVEDTSVSPSSPSVTTTSDGDVAVFGVGVRSISTAFSGSATPPSGTTQLFLAQTRAFSSGAAYGMAYELRPTAGATGTRTWSDMMTASKYFTAWSFAIKAGATGPTIDTITDPVVGSMTITLSESAAEVDGIYLVVGSREESQGYTTGDDTTFTIASVSRATLPPIAASMTVELRDGAAVVASTTVELDPRDGYSAWVGASINFSETGIAYNHTGDTPVNGDILELSDSPNTSSDGTESASTWTVSQSVTRAFDARVWQASSETYGATTIYSVSGNNVISSVVGGIMAPVITSTVN